MRYNIFIASILLLTGCQHSLLRKNQAFMDYYSRQSEKNSSSVTEYPYEKWSADVTDKYEKIFGSRKPEYSSYDAKLLKESWKSAFVVSFHSLEQKHLLRMEDIFENLKQRGMEQEDCVMGTCVEGLFHMYIKFGELAKAEQLRGNYPGLLPNFVPEIHQDAAALDGPNRKIYKLAPDGRSLTLTSARLDKELTVVAIMGPGCHFAQLAIKDISSTPDLRDYFEKHALIIAPLNASISGIPGTAEWNKANPGLEHFIYMERPEVRGDWKQFNVNSGLTLYFLKNGQIVYQIPGWGPTSEEYISSVREGINKV